MCGPGGSVRRARGPKLLDVALPANLRSGEPLDGRVPEADWASIVVTYAGIPELGPEWSRCIAPR